MNERHFRPTVGDGAVRSIGAAPDRAVWTRVEGIKDFHLDLLAARIGRRHYAPHAHEEYAIGVCTAGLEVIGYRGDRHHAGPGSVVVIQPGEPHTGGPADEGGFSYRVLYPAPELLAEAVPCRATGTPAHFREAVVDDPWLAGRLREMHRALSRPGGEPLAVESTLLSVLGTVVGRHADVRGDAVVDGADTAAEWIARAVSSRLADELTDPPSLGEMAVELGLSRYRLLRAFRQVVGMPPYAWLAQHRVARARRLLDAGGRPAEVATLVGFADQAHLTRWFRRVLGVTPGIYRNSVQDGVRIAAGDWGHFST